MTRSYFSTPAARGTTLLLLLLVYYNSVVLLPIIACVGTKQHPQSSSVSFKHRDLNETTYDKLRQLIFEGNWDILHSLDIHDAYNNFVDIVSHLLDVVAPEKTISIKQHQLRHEPWFTKGLMRSRKNLNKLYREKCSHPHQRHANKWYTQYRNLYNKLKRITLETYYKYCQLLQNYKNDVKNTWKTIRHFIGKHN